MLVQGKALTECVFFKDMTTKFFICTNNTCQPMDAEAAQIHSHKTLDMVQTDNVMLQDFRKVK